MAEDSLPALVADALPRIDPAIFAAPGDPGHAPRILLLYGSLRDQSYSRFAAEEAARLLRHLGCETRLFDPAGLPLVDEAREDNHPKVAELRELADWIRTTHRLFARDEYGTVAPDFDLQARLYQAFFEQLWDDPWLAGIIIWKWHPEHDHHRPFLELLVAVEPVEAALVLVQGFLVVALVVVDRQVQGR